MKKFLCAILLLALCAFGAAAEEMDEYIAIGEDVVALMGEKARSEEYIALYTADPTAAEYVLGFAGAGLAGPDAIYQIRFGADFDVPLLLGDGSLDGVPEALVDELLSRIYAVIAQSYISAEGTYAIVASSVLTVTQACAGAPEANMLLVFTYGDVAAFVDFRGGVGDAMTVTGTFYRPANRGDSDWGEYLMSAGAAGSLPEGALELERLR